VSQADTSLRGTLEFLRRAAFERRKQTLGYHRAAASGILWRLWAAHLGRRRPPKRDRRQLWRFGPELVDYRPEELT
jgi:hypothetical protein